MQKSFRNRNSMWQGLRQRCFAISILRKITRKFGDRVNYPELTLSPNFRLPLFCPCIEIGFRPRKRCYGPKAEERDLRVLRVGDFARPCSGTAERQSGSEFIRRWKFL